LKRRRSESPSSRQLPVDSPQAASVARGASMRRALRYRLGRSLGSIPPGAYLKQRIRSSRNGSFVLGADRNRLPALAISGRGIPPYPRGPASLGPRLSRASRPGFSLTRASLRALPPYRSALKPFDSARAFFKRTARSSRSWLFF